MSKRAMMMAAGVLLTAALANGADYTNGLVARWTFKHADKTLDDFGANSALTVGNGVTFSLGQAVFDGTTAATLNAGRGTNAELDITPAITIWMRVNLNVAGTWHGLAQRWGTAVTNQSFTWYVRPPTLCSMQMNQCFRTYTNATDYVQSASVALPIYNTYTNYYGSFHNVALVFKPTRAVNYGAWEYYIDGTQVGWATAYKLTNNAGGYWNVGTWSSATEPLVFGYLKGVVDEIRVYNIDLNATGLNQIVPYALPRGTIIFVR